MRKAAGRQRKGSADKRPALALVKRSPATLSEARSLERLKALIGRSDDILAFLLSVLTARPASSGDEVWLIAASSGEDSYLVNIEMRVCTCKGFRYSHGSCKHLRAGDVAARLRYLSTVAASENQG